MDIRKLIASNELDLAFSKLKSLENSTEVVLLESRYNKLKKLNINGTIENVSFNLELNKIKFAMLELGNFKQNFIDSTSPISIKKIEEDEKITLRFRRETVGQTYEIKANPNTKIGDLARQILISFEPDYKNNFLFRENMVSFYVEKIFSGEQRKKLPNNRKIKDLDLKNNDTIIMSLKFNIRRISLNASFRKC